MSPQQRVHQRLFGHLPARLLSNLLGKVIKLRHINLKDRLGETQSKRLRYFLSTLGQKQLANLLDRQGELLLRLRGRAPLFEIKQHPPPEPTMVKSWYSPCRFTAIRIIPSSVVN